MPRATKAYTEDSIKRHKGLAGVRSRPTMYLGERGKQMSLHAVKELFENSCDEFFAGRNSSVYVYLNNKKNTYVVSDEAQGVPCGLVPEDPENPRSKKVSMMTLIFTEIHTGGKFQNGKGAYANSRGVHGVGASATNAVSSRFEVWTRREGKTQFQAFEQGKPKAIVAPVRSIPKEVKDLVPALYHQKGTTIRFSLDKSVVADEQGNMGVDYKAAANYFKMYAYLNPGLRVTLSLEGKPYEFYNKHGIKHVLERAVEKTGADQVGKPIIATGENFSLAIAWVASSETTLSTFVCSGQTEEHGNHELGMRRALHKAIKPHLGPKEKLTEKELYVGLVGIFDWKMPEPAFGGQTKGKLVSEVDKEVEAILHPIFVEAFAKGPLARSIIRRSLTYKKALEAASNEAKTVDEAAKKAKKESLAGIHYSCPDVPAEERELYILEGDSALGSAKLARNVKNQELFSLSGKIMNVARKSTAEAVKSIAIARLFTVLGYEFKKGQEPTNFRVGKVVLLPDADSDGFHIATLLLTLIWKFCPSLLQDGRIYVVEGALFCAHAKGKNYYGATFDECYKQLPRGSNKNLVSRIKGWGEIPCETLAEMAFDPTTRRLIQVKASSGKDLEKFIALVSDDSAARKNLLDIE